MPLKLNLNEFMHPRNPYKEKKPDFKALAIKYPEFRDHASQDIKGAVHIGQLKKVVASICFSTSSAVIRRDICSPLLDRFQKARMSASVELGFTER